MEPSWQTIQTVGINQVRPGLAFRYFAALWQPFNPKIVRVLQSKNASGFHAALWFGANGRVERLSPRFLPTFSPCDL